MKLSKRDAKLLLILLGIVTFLLSYLLVYNHYIKKQDAVAQQISELTPKLNTLEEYYANLSSYESAIEEARTSTKQELRRYPTEVLTEDQTLYALELEQRLGINVTALTFSDPLQVSEFSGILPDGSEKPVKMDAYQSTMNVSCEMTYAQLKQMLRYIYDTNDYTSVASLSVSYDAETAKLKGNVDVSKFFIQYEGAEKGVHVMPFVPEGRPNIFG